MSRLGLALLLLQGSVFTGLAADATTTISPDKGKNQTETTAEPPLYQVNNKGGEPCIFMEMDAYVSINWEVSSNETKEIDMILQSSKVETTGSCADEEAHIILTWKSFRLQWDFSKTRDWKKWFVKQVELQYDKSILDRKTNGTTGFARAAAKSSSDVMLFSAPAGEAYRCAAEDELDLSSANGSDSALLRLRKFRVQPFLTKPAFGPSYCPTHTTSAVYESSTISSVSPNSGLVKTASNHSSDDSVHPNVASASPASQTSVPFTPSRIAIPNKLTYSSTPRYSMHSNPPNPSVNPFRDTTRASLSVNQTPLHEVVSPTKTPEFYSTTAAPLAIMPPYVYQKTMPNVIKMPYYPPKKMFFSGVKLDNNDALSAMLWSWYTSGFYTGYYQALQQSKKM